MNQGQEQFFKFILDCVQPGREDDAKKLLAESFKLQSENNFTADALTDFHQKLTEILKPERKEEVINIMNQFGSAHTSN